MDVESEPPISIDYSTSYRGSAGSGDVMFHTLGEIS